MIFDTSSISMRGGVGRILVLEKTEAAIQFSENKRTACNGRYVYIL